MIKKAAKRRHVTEELVERAVPSLVALRYVSHCGTRIVITTDLKYTATSIHQAKHLKLGIQGRN